MEGKTTRRYDLFGTTIRNMILTHIVFFFVFLFSLTTHAQITRRGTATTNANNGGLSLSIDKPTGIVAGDILIANILQNETDNDNGGLNAVTATGWILVDGRIIRSDGTNNGDNAWHGTILYRIADGTEGATFSFTLPNSRADMAIGSIVAFSGVTSTGGVRVDGTAGGPFDIRPGTLNLTNTSTATASTATTVTNGAAVLMLAMVNNDRSYSNWAATNPASFEELYDNVTTISDDGSVGAAWAIRTVAGATGNGTVTLSGSDRSGAMFLVLKPNPCTAPASPGSITSPSTICNGSTGNAFSIASVSGASSYQWTVTGTGWSVTAGQGTNNATITAGSGIGTVSVTAVSSCGASSAASSTPTITPVAGPSVNAGAVLNPICKGGTSAALGGTVGGSATTGIWSDGGIGGSFNPNATTLDATYTPPASFSGTVTLTLTTTNGQCSNVSSNKTLVVTAPPVATISYSNASYCNSVLTSQSCTISGTTGGSFSASPAGLSINSATGAIQPSSSAAGIYTINYTIAASGGCNAVSNSTTVTIINDQNTISYPALSYCTSNTSTIAVTRNAPAGGTYTASPSGLSINASTGAINLGASALGSYTITYTYSGGACSTTASTSLNLNAQPNVTCPANLAVCSSAASFTLTGGAPIGGTYSGTGVSGNNFNPSGLSGLYTITYSFTNSSGCTSSCNFSINVVSGTPVISATPVSNTVYTGNNATINLNSNIPGTQYTWTASSNNPAISGFSNQSTPVTGPINQQLINTSPNVGQVTYTISSALSGCASSTVTVVINMPSATFCENPGTFQAGSCIIDMGVKPQTYNNGLKPYGLLYQLVNVYRVPVYWAIKPDKAFSAPWPKSDPVDFTLDGRAYSGGAFIIPANFLSQVQSVINNWAAQGVVVRYASSSFSPPYFELITRIPRVVLDAANGALVETGFYTKAGIPSDAYTKGGIPSAITNCDDIYVLPHAEPQNWTLAQRDSLWNFVNNRGWFFSSCYAVSFIENLSGSGSRRLNFLSNNGLIPYNQHGNPTLPYAYSTGPGAEAASIAADPFMQFVDTIDRAINNDGAFEKIYVPSAAGWRATTRAAIYKTNYTNNGITYPSSAAILAYGRAFGDNNKGMVMYLSGHDFEGGVTESDNVAKARIYGSFLLRSGIGTRPTITPVSIPNTANSGQTISLQVSVPPSTSSIITYEWTSDQNGIFSAPQSTITNFTAPTVDVPTVCTIQFKVTDACGRVGLYCTAILINPTITNNYISTAQAICQGNIPAPLNGTVSVAPGNATVSYLWLMSTTGITSGYTAAPGTNNQQNYTPVALNQTSWFIRRVSANGVTVFSTPIEITVASGPEITVQPATATQGLCQGGAGTFNPLTVSSSVASVTYQWYSNTIASNTGGTLIAGATNPSYTPSISLPGTFYYYCQVSSPSGCPSVSDVSGAISIISGLQITTQPSIATQSICVGETNPLLTVAANGSSLQYQWYYNTSASNGTGSVLIPGATASTYLPSLVGSYYYHVRIFSPSCNSLLKSNPSGLFTVNTRPTPGITNNSGTTVITCDTRIISLTATGGSTYQWSNSLGANNAATITAPGTYSVTVTSANGCSAISNIVITSAISGSTWTGEYDAEWEHEENWCGGVPTSSSDVIIPAGTPNDPVIHDEVAEVRNITVSNGSVLYLDDQTLQIFGTVNASGNINSVNGAIEVKGNMPQTITASMFAAHRVRNLKLSNAAGITLSGNDTLKLTGVLEFGASAVTFNTNNNFTIASDINGTGSVADMTANGNYTGNKILGNVTVERYIPNHPKAWQLLAVPTTGQTVKQAWQEGNAPLSNTNNPGYGTIITSHLSGATTTLGFDIFTPAGSTMKTFSPADSTWVGIPTTNMPIANEKGYMILVRGDRSVTAFNQAATATTMRTSGLLYQPEINAPAMINVMANKYECVGNPYASAIDVSKLIRTGGVQDVYYVWDPKLTSSPFSAWGLGAFQTIVRNGSGYRAVPGGGSYANGNINIESGQAFLVRSLGTAGTLAFAESAKTSGSNLVTRNQSATMSFSMNLSVLNAGDPVLLDGTFLSFDPAYNNQVDMNDAMKIGYGTTENIAIRKNNLRLVAEQRSIPQRSDTVFYQLGSLKRQTYQLDIMASQMSSAGLTAKLVDRYLGTTTNIDLRGENIYTFSVNADAMSYATDRIYVVFNKTRSVPVRTLSTLQVSKSNMTSNDKNAHQASFDIYPNPVTDHHATMKFSYCKSGEYMLKLYDLQGKQLMQNTISVNSGTENKTLRLDKKIPAGVYQLELTSSDGLRYSNRIIIK